MWRHLALLPTKLFSLAKNAHHQEHIKMVRPHGIVWHKLTEMGFL